MIREEGGWRGVAGKEGSETTTRSPDRVYRRRQRRTLSPLSPPHLLMKRRVRRKESSSRQHLAALWIMKKKMKRAGRPFSGRTIARRCAMGRETRKGDVYFTSTYYRGVDPVLVDDEHRCYALRSRHQQLARHLQCLKNYHTQEPATYLYGYISGFSRKHLAMTDMTFTIPACGTRCADYDPVSTCAPR